MSAAMATRAALGLRREMRGISAATATLTAWGAILSPTRVM